MVLMRPLDLTDCLIDSPHFRENLASHERQIGNTRKAVGSIIDHSQVIINCTQALSSAYKDLAMSLYQLGGDGTTNDDDDAPLFDAETSRFMKDISKLILQIEDEREQMPSRLEEAFIKPLKRAFLSSDCQEDRKRFQKDSPKFHSFVSDAAHVDSKAMLTERNKCLENSVEYVHKLQSFQLSKRFEVLDALVCLVNHQMNFYHLSYEIVKNFKPLYPMNVKLQNMRDEVDCQVNDSEIIKQIILENPCEYLRSSLHHSPVLVGHLLVMRKLLFGAVWFKSFCEYRRVTRQLLLIPFGHFANNSSVISFVVKSCSALLIQEQQGPGRPFCFEVKLENPTNSKEYSLILQAQDDNDRRLWLDAMKNDSCRTEVASLGPSEIGFRFAKTCFAIIEAKYLSTPGLYRISGVKGQVTELLENCLGNDNNGDDVNCDKNKKKMEDVLNECFDLNVITSAVKSYFSSRLSEPLMTFDLYDSFLYVSTLDTEMKRVRSVHYLVQRLPSLNVQLLKLLVFHLAKVAANSEENKMTASNLGVCFGPILFWPRNKQIRLEDVLSTNAVVQLLIDNAYFIFETKPTLADVAFVFESWRQQQQQTCSGTVFTGSSAGSPFSVNGSQKSSAADVSLAPVATTNASSTSNRQHYLIAQGFTSILAHLTNQQDFNKKRLSEETTASDGFTPPLLSAVANSQTSSIYETCENDVDSMSVAVGGSSNNKRATLDDLLETIDGTDDRVTIVVEIAESSSPSPSDNNSRHLMISSNTSSLPSSLPDESSNSPTSSSSSTAKIAVGDGLPRSDRYPVIATTRN